jgi:hypothetical protein
VTVSTRSRVLLVASAIAPITAVSLRVASRQQRRVIAADAKQLLGFDAGLLPMILTLLGILCFVGFPASLFTGYLRSR